MPRPYPVMTAEQIEQLGKLAAHLTLEQIADFFEVSTRTLRRRMQNDARVVAAYKKGKSTAISRVAETLLKAAENGNMTAAIFYLKTQAGWRETDPRQLPVDDIPKLTDKELEREKKRMGIVR